MNKTIYLIGAGAIGKALAISLSLAGRNILLVKASRDDLDEQWVEVKNKEGAGPTKSAKVKMISLSKLEALEGMLVLTTKSYANEKIAGRLKGKTGDSPIVILQNGIGVEKAFVESNFPEVYRGVLFATSENLGPFEISYKPVAPSPIGIVQNARSQLEEIVGYLHTPSFEFVAELAIEKIIWQKAIINCVFNSICPLLEVDNGIFNRSESAFQLAREIVGEGVAVANRLGLGLEQGQIEEKILFISRASDGQLISTLQDLQRKQATEIDSLNLAIARIATELGLENVTTRTKMFGELIKYKSGIH